MREEERKRKEEKMRRSSELLGPDLFSFLLKRRKTSNNYCITITANMHGLPSFRYIGFLDGKPGLQGGGFRNLTNRWLQDIATLLGGRKTEWPGDRGCWGKHVSVIKFPRFTAA